MNDFYDVMENLKLLVQNKGWKLKLNSIDNL